MPSHNLAYIKIDELEIIEYLDKDQNKNAV
jgi:hypothetical protein